MIECQTKVKEGYKKEYAYTTAEFKELINTKYGGFLPLDTEGGYISTPLTYDIETTLYRDAKESLEEDRDVYKSFMYHWQMCICGEVVFGRDWGDWCDFLDLLRDRFRADKSRKIVIYVHNLSYEFEFFNKFVELNSVFATDAHKVLKCTVNDCFEFRCSYYLSNMSLEKFISTTPGTEHLKAGGDLDYKIFRTTKTDLTPIEYGYCFNDVKGLYEALLGILKEDSIKTIPLTSTGYVRRDCRNAMRKNYKNRNVFVKSKLNLKQYRILKDAFRGGNTASNRYNTGVILNDVNSYDIKSSYPFVMLAFEYPAGEMLYRSIETRKELDYYNNKYCTIGYYNFDRIELKDDIPIPYLPTAKCLHMENVEAFNGRILAAKNVMIALTNIDFEIIEKQYNIEGLSIADFYFMRKELLPAELRGQIIEYFTLKCKLDGVQGKEYEYMKSKNKLNSIYGMTVTDILHPEWIFENGEFKEQLLPQDEQESKLQKHFTNRNNFLVYQWGVFVTSYARRQLQIGIDRICAAGGAYDMIYCDTDSIKYLGEYDIIFEQLNNEILQYCYTNGIINYVNVNNKRYILGLFNKEKSYEEFITLGAKKYAFKQDGKIGVTVSGLNKEEGGKELTAKGGLKAFKVGEVFTHSGRTVAYYNNEDIHIIEFDGEKIVTRSNIAIVDTTYTLGITDTMLSILKTLEVI